MYLSKIIKYHDIFFGKIARINYKFIKQSLLAKITLQSLKLELEMLFENI